jgi:repressor LexA
MVSKNEELNNREKDAVRIIRNYVMNEGELPTVRELMSEMGYKSPRSAAEVIEKLESKGVLQRNSDGSLKFLDVDPEDSERAETVGIPLVGEVACGTPIFAEENIRAYIPVSVKLAKPPQRYFFLRAKGDSMNGRGINDGDLVLIKQQNTAANGDLVVALIDDEATIKELHRTNDMVILQPRSSNPIHQPIILTKDFQIQGIVVTSIPIN